MSRPVIRRFRPADARAVRRLVQSVLREHGLWTSHKHLMGDLDDPRRSYPRPKGDFLVVADGARVVGCGGLEPRGGRRAALQRMYILKPWRGKGLGKKVLERLLTTARRAHIKAVTLETAPRLRAALALYRARGFRRIKSLSTDCCSVKMKLTFGPGPS